MHKIAFGSARVGLSLIVLTLILSAFLAVSAQSTASPWLSATLSLQKDGDLPPGSAVPFSYIGNRDCTDHEFITRPGGLIVPQAKHNACGVQSNYGIVDPNGWLELNGTRTAGRLVNFGVYSPGNIPIPRSQNLINYTSGPAGQFLHFTKNLPGAITASVSSTAEVTYQINRAADASLRDKAGTLLPTQTDSLSFSDNGEWMVVDGRNRAMLRVNTETLDVLPFAPTFNYSIGLGPGLQTAVTSDGRLAVVYSKNFGVFSLYDLNTCAVVPNSINSPVACQSRDLQAVINQQLPGLQSISRIRFISDDTLSFYANYYSTPGNPLSNKIGKFRLTIGTASNSQVELLALGDSYISGEGAFEYRAGTDIPDNRCHLSLVSYPYLVAISLDLNSFNSVACSGARILDIEDVTRTYNEKRAQADGKADPSFDNEIYNGFLPGYRAQINFVSRNKPEKILLSIGGNDVGFSKILRRCLEPDTCYSTYEDRVEVVREINGQFPKLAETYQKIQQEGLPGAKIYAVGYPQIVKPGGSCDLNVRLNAQELEFAKLLTAYLNEVIKRAADRAGIAYTDTQEALNGHRLCEAVDENAAVNGLTAGDNTPSFLRGPIGNESYHPNKLGHQLLSQKILSETQNLSRSMPAAAANSAVPAEDGLEILNAPKSNRSINKTNYDGDLANDMVFREMWLDLALDGLKYSLKRLLPINLVLNSEPISLGAFNTDGSGGLSAQYRIPDTVPTGFHTLHIYGTNLANEPVDIYKTIYVAANEIDYDGDGVANSLDPCTTMPESGVDKDKDGIDDACDGVIGLAPIVAAVNVSSSPSSTSTPTPTPASAVRGPSSHMTTDEVQPAGSADELTLNSGPAAVLAENVAGLGTPTVAASNKRPAPLLDLTPNTVLAAMSLGLGGGIVLLRRLVFA